MSRNVFFHLPIVMMAMCLLGVSPYASAQETEVAPSAEETLLEALQTFTAMVQQEKEPDVAIVAPLKTIFDENQEAFAANVEVVKAALEAVQAYEEQHGPLFIARGEWDKGHRRKRTPPPDDIHWTVYHVMQYIFDQVYTAENVLTYRDALENYSFGTHVFFPGPVDPPADPDAIYVAQVDATSPTNGPSFETLGGVRRPTGAYVVPGHYVTIEVPESIVNKGYQLRVGAHSWDNTEKRRVTRLARVSTVYDIDKPKITVAHPLGGGIYLEVPLGADDGVVEIKIKGAARSPLFAATHFQKTTLKDWLEVESKRKAPWVDFHTDKFMMQVPTMWVYNLKDPVKLMADWDKACDAQNELFGQPLVKARHTHYLQVDLQNRGRAFYPGYPTCNDRYHPAQAEEYAGYADHYLVRGPQFAPGYVFHEQGHAFMCPKYPGERESVVNLPHVAVWNRKFDVPLDEAFAASRGVTGVTNTLDATAVAWMCIESFAKDEPMTNYEKQYQLKGHAKYVEIARLFGWDVLSKYWAGFNEEVADGTYKGRHAYSNDEITLRKSIAAGVDLRPLVRFWGIHEDDPEKLAEQIRQAEIPASAEIYDTLVHYKSLIPADNAAFRTFALMWWKGKQPSPEGFTTERNHAAYWDTYNGETAAALTQIVQNTIDTYFPEGRPDA